MSLSAHWRACAGAALLASPVSRASNAACIRMYSMNGSFPSFATCTHAYMTMILEPDIAGSIEADLPSICVAPFVYVARTPDHVLIMQTPSMLHVSD